MCGGSASTRAGLNPCISAIYLLQQALLESLLELEQTSDDPKNFAWNHIQVKITQGRISRALSVRFCEPFRNRDVKQSAACFADLGERTEQPRRLRAARCV